MKNLINVPKQIEAFVVPFSRKSHMITLNDVEIFYTEFLINRPRTMGIMGKNFIYTLKRSVTVFALIFIKLAMTTTFL